MRKLVFAGVAVGCALGLGAAGAAQSNPSNSAVNPYAGSIQAVAATADVRDLSLDDAIRLGIENNLALHLAKDQLQSAQA
jgi:hypothetical protein